jgi:hypothetical protein
VKTKLQTVAFRVASGILTFPNSAEYVRNSSCLGRLSDISYIFLFILPQRHLPKLQIGNCLDNRFFCLPPLSCTPIILSTVVSAHCVPRMWHCAWLLEALNKYLLNVSKMAIFVTYRQAVAGCLL